MNYQIVAIKEEDSYFWGVVENKTEQLINAFFFQEDAVNYASFLEEGGGFAGFTPSFVLNSVKVPESLDETFMREFDVTE